MKALIAVKHAMLVVWNILATATSAPIPGPSTSSGVAPPRPGARAVGELEALGYRVTPHRSSPAVVT